MPRLFVTSNDIFCFGMELCSCWPHQPERPLPRSYLISVGPQQNGVLNESATFSELFFGNYANTWRICNNVKSTMKHVVNVGMLNLVPIERIKWKSVCFGFQRSLLRASGGLMLRAYWRKCETRRNEFMLVNSPRTRNLVDGRSPSPASCKYYTSMIFNAHLAMHLCA